MQIAEKEQEEGREGKVDPLWRNPGLEGEREKERGREWDGFACIVSDSEGPTDRGTATDLPYPALLQPTAAARREDGRWALINGHSPFLREHRAGGLLRQEAGRPAGKEGSAR